MNDTYGPEGRISEIERFRKKSFPKAEPSSSLSRGERNKKPNSKEELKQMNLNETKQNLNSRPQG